ncbi:hypothetical protein V8G57_16950 [Collimonas sp. H4R21]|jgi:hypothetical protein|uniref:Uncharacterized protein n=1 Tax=Collimonas rhizosphaerae TaxID=3126357 RepID=A0ABU9PYJ1_9BURK|nr:hypothetical protein [Collimonas sp. OK412]SFB80446.1 hypothetical protein SAMN04515619_10233 [Collimonas sp. OK412]
MINPEFKRNLWLQFSLHRLIAMPAILGLVFFTLSLANDNWPGGVPLDSVALVLFGGIVCLWGTRNASNAVIEEIRDKTWDQQRMSALDPWTMTWGKLFGATAFNWYGGLLCLLVFVIAALVREHSMPLSSGLTLAALGILMHAATIALNLHLMRSDIRAVQRGGIAWAVVLIAVMFAPPFRSAADASVSWWGQPFAYSSFLLASVAFFAAIAVFAAWRSMNSALQITTAPWAWPLACCLLAAYVGGFSGGAGLLWIGLLFALAMTYAALFTEENDIALWQRVVARAKTGNWHGLFQNLPIWPTTLVLSFCLALLLQFSSAQELPFKLRITTADLSFLAPALALMLLRDCCVYLFFAFSGKSKRVGATTILYLALINGLLPFLSNMMGLKALAIFFMPLHIGNGWQMLGIALLHAALALALLGWRWRRQALQDDLPQPV